MTALYTNLLLSFFHFQFHCYWFPMFYTHMEWVALMANWVVQVTYKQMSMIYLKYLAKLNSILTFSIYIAIHRWEINMNFIYICCELSWLLIFLTTSRFLFVFSFGYSQTTSWYYCWSCWICSPNATTCKYSFALQKKGMSFLKVPFHSIFFFFNIKLI